MADNDLAQLVLGRLDQIDAALSQFRDRAGSPLLWAQEDHAFLFRAGGLADQVTEVREVQRHCPAVSRLNVATKYYRVMPWITAVAVVASVFSAGIALFVAIRGL
jgi:hypothetical protein